MQTEIRRKYYHNGNIETEESFLIATEIRHGIQTWYYPNGQKYTELIRINNKFHGINLNWYENSMIHFIEQLIKHSEHGPRIKFKY